MNPETITTSQILGSLTAKQLLAIISTAISVCAACAYGGFWAGGQIVEAKLSVQQAESKVTAAQIQSELELTQATLRTSITTSEQMQEALARSQKLVERQSIELTRLNEELGRSNNCAFIHQQILDTTREIEGTGSMIVFSDDAEWQEKQRNRRAMLEKRLNGYQQQLGTCNK